MSPVDISVDEAQRLVRLFLTGQAEAADISRLGEAVAEDQGTALELLSQMQTALDDSAPGGLTGEQSSSVTARVTALVAPRIKKRGLFSFIAKLFKRKPKAPPEAPPETARGGRYKGASAAPAPAISDPVMETMPGDGMEDMAPIAASAPPPPLEVAPIEVSEPKAEAKPKRWLKPALAGLALLLVAGGGAWWWMNRPQPVAKADVVVVPQPTPVPTPKGRTARATALAPNSDEALPAEFPATTPIAAGTWDQP